MLDYEAESRENYNILSQLFNITHVSYKEKRLINNYSKGVVYLLLCLGVPKKQLQYILFNSLNYCTSKESKLIFEELKRNYRAEIGKCSICGSTEELQVHHIKPISRYAYLKYNPVNWVVVCADCHKELHDVLGV